MAVYRRIDALGRIVIPRRVRSLLNIEEDDEFEIIFEEENGDVTLRKCTVPREEWSNRV